MDRKGFPNGLRKEFHLGQLAYFEKKSDTLPINFLAAAVFFGSSWINLSRFSTGRDETIKLRITAMNKNRIFMPASDTLNMLCHVNRNIT